MAPLHPRSTSWLSFALASVVVLIAGCPGSEIRERVDAEVDRPNVRFTAPLQDARFQASGGIAAVPTSVFAQLPSREAFVEMSLDGAPLEKLPAASVVAGILGERTFEYTYAAVPIGLHTFKVQALDPSETPYKNPESVDTVDVFVIGPCNTDADCDDGNDCSEERCLSTGFCTYVKVPGCEPVEAPDGEDPGPDALFPDFPCKSTDPLDFCANKYPEEFGNLGNCQVAFCDGVAQECRKLDVPNNTPCEDGNLCTGGDFCANGLCQSGTTISCDDGDLCTNDSCNPATGCVFEYDPITCECITDAQCGALEDGNPCTGELRCIDFQCVTDPATVPNCGDPVGCMVGACNPETGGCDLVPVADFTTCDDGNICTEQDVCVAGDCGGAVLSCADGNICTDDFCDPDSGCVNQPAEGTPCTDGNVCTLDDSCDTAGNCLSGPPLNCNDQNLCTVDACDTVVGCVFDAGPLNGTPCDDDDLCTGPGTCFEGFCVVPLVPCNDGNPCTDDSCDPLGGCEFTNNNAPCDDGDPCTVGDACQAGACVGGTAVVCDDGNPCTEDVCIAGGGCSTNPLTGPACDDGNVCTQTDTCVNGACVGSNPLACDDNNPCTINACDALLGCQATNAANGTPCDDGSECTDNDQCVNGVCQGQGVVCDDNNPCTQDTCTLADGCAFTPIAGPCDDGNACTVGDQCVAGACQPGAPANCDDNNVCTDDSCQPASGCMNAPNVGPCDDGNLCTDGDQCVGGACVGQPLDCEDGDPCTTNTCDPASGCVSTFNNSPCDDGDFCTINDACQAGECIGGGANPACENVICEVTGDVGDEVICPLDMIRVSQFVPIPAALQFTMNFDAVALQLLRFQDEICILPGLCFMTNVPLDAPQVSTGHTFSIEPPVTTNWAGTGSAILVNLTDPTSAVSPAYLLPDGTVQDEPTFLEAVFRLEQPIPLAAPSLVTLPVVIVSSAAAEQLPAYVEDLVIYVDGEAQCQPQFCNDGNPCTIDTCDALGQDCVFIPQTGTACDDGDPCTLDDQCVAGSCAPGSPVVCDDGNPCTENACNSDSGGCTTTPLDGTPCDDGNACTTGDQCVAGNCAGTPLNCDDGNVCTTNTCDIATGCVSANNNNPCNDGDACTSGDTCQGGLCAGTPVDCDDGNVCTTNTCDAASGCQSANNNNPCDDASLCTDGDVCQGGACVGTPVSCDDGNVCTTNSCDPAAGCVTANNSAPCDDGDFCTLNDTCAGGVCVGGATNPVCLNVICLVEGQIGEEVICPMNIIRLSQFVDTPAALQFTMNFDFGALTLARFQDDICLAPGLCFTVNVPVDSPQVSTGHSLNMQPAVTTDWVGNGTAILVNLSEPTVGLSDAYLLPDASVVGESHFLDAVFTLKANLVAGGPGSYVTLPDVIVSSPAAEVLPSFVDDFVIYVDGEVNCLPALCDDGNPCTLNTCDAQGLDCLFIPLSETSCDDGDACTDGDFCDAGVCVGGSPVECDDENECTTSTCNSQTGCVTTPLSGPSCDDGNACTSSDQCVAGTCVGSPVVCDDANVCTTNSCDPTTGCVFTNNNAACDDGNACTEGDTCSAGACVGQPVSCDDADDCTADSCNPATGCVNTPAELPCDDGDFCTISDTCTLAGACVGTTPNPECDNTACKLVGTAGTQVICPLKIARVNSTVPLPVALQLDLNYNNTVMRLDVLQDEICMGPVCVDTPTPPSNLSTGHSVTIFPTNAVDWDGFGTVLLVNLADPTVGISEAYLDGAGQMVDEPLFAEAVFTLLQDADLASPALVTYSGIVVAKADAASMDYFVADDTIFVDSDLTCNPAACNDNNPCTQDGCDFITDACVFVPLTGTSCDDGNACTANDTCQAGACVGTAVQCDDGDACNGVESCDSATGCVPGTSLTCDDGNACTVDSCDSATGCVSQPLTCSDGVACTVDSCSPATGCVFTPNDALCSDSDACNGVETCSAASGCLPGAPVVCGDGNPCNGEETCNPASGACEAGIPLDCDDGSACTVDSCNPGVGCVSVASGCDDGIACTVDSCDDALGCIHTPNNAACADGNACNGSETCDAAAGCLPGTPINCDDGNVCNGAEACEPLTGTCTPGLPLVCDDGNLCNGAETCNPASGCQSGSPLNCNDGIACTVDSCNPASGCENSPNNAACNDGNVCNGAEVCQAGVGCVAGSPLVCDDANACTVDSCNPVTGCTTVPLSCDDGIACTVDSCNVATGCVFTPNNGLCDDGNACTAGICSAATGCSFPDIDCDDGDACTVDSCNPAAGCGSLPVNCDDGDLCTDDFCDSLTGACDFVFNNEPCDDGDFCSLGDACNMGECVGSSQNPSCANAICEVSGVAGDVFICPLNLARLTQGTSIPAGIQFNVVFNGTQLEALKYTSFVNIPGIPVAIEADVPPQPLGTGHTVVNFPEFLTTWNDEPGAPNTKTSAGGSTLIANFGDPTAAITQAYFDASSTLSGDPFFMNLYVQLLADFDTSSPALVYLDKVIATTPAAEPMIGVVNNKFIVVYEVGQCTVDEDCDDGDPCTLNVCNVNGLCNTFPNDGGACDDGDLCTEGDTCTSGACSGTAKDCNDSNPGTADSCDPETGACINTPVGGGACDDGDACTLGDTLIGGVCVGSPIVCDDGNACTDDFCVGGTCSFTNNAAPCNDGSLCTTGDVCSGGSCQGAPVVCIDDFPCDGTDVCNPTTGLCQPDFTNLPFCGDGILQPECFEECDDGNNVAGDGCGPSCLIEPCLSNADCDDANPCTNDVCLMGVGCQYTNNSGPCDNGDPCTTNDVCGGGVCNAGSAVVCNDGIACTVDSCTPGVGCSYTENDALCNDGNACTLNLCNGASGCEFVPIANGGACNDSNACTVGETCTGGVCGGGSAVNCDDGNVCTSESCNPATGCAYVNLTGNACNDGDSCTENEKCNAGVCGGGVASCGEPLCEIVGNAGDEVDCELQIAKAAQTQDGATGLQFVLQFNRKMIHIMNFYDEHCFAGVGCFLLPVFGAGGQPLSTQHTMSIAPVSLANWNGTVCSAVLPCAGGAACVGGLCEGTGGFGAVVIVNLTNPSAVISTAYLDAGGNVVGNPTFVLARFKLQQDILTPVTLDVAQLGAAQKDSLPLKVEVFDQLMVSSP